MIHKTTRSILSVLLAVLLLVTSVPLTPAFADGGGVPPQSANSERGGLEGSGKEGDPYQIATADDLLKFAKLVNDGETTAWAVLTDDIDLNPDMKIDEDGKVTNGKELDQWTPIGNSESTAYTGTFNGQNFKISGLYIKNTSSDTDDQGLFGYVSGTVENCYNTGNVSVTSSDISNVGGVVGYNHGGRVENCYNTGDVTGGSYVGGVVGQNSDGTSVSASVTNCYNTGEVSGNSNVGGVVGDNGGTVTDCYFLQQGELPGIGGGSAEGAKSLTADQFKDQNSFPDWDFGSTDTWRIHPVLGRPELNENREGGDGTAAHPYEIKTAAQLENFRNLVNNGIEKSAHAKLMNNINLNGNATNQWTPIGNEDHLYTGTFDGNGKTISGLYIKSSSANDQGLFGFVGSEGTVQNLSVSGSVKGNSYVGGVVGYNDRGTVTGCIFSGSGSVSGVTGSDYVGGVVGDNRGTVENCYNTGSVKGSGNSVGGVVGYNSSSIVADNSSNVENCYNIGEVSGNSYVGGVVGQNFGGVENCYNTGEVSGGECVGGVVGDNRGTVKNCYNTGSVSDGTYTGGVVGWNLGTVENCYNTGSVTSSGSYVGGVVGWNVSGYDAIPDGIVANCYYQIDKGAKVGIGGTTADDTTTVAKTAEQFASGEVAHLLEQNVADSEKPVWGQNIKDGNKDNYPQLRAFDADTPQVYKVAFMNDSEEHDAKYANSGMTVGSPTTNPTKDGYTFAGWFTKSSGGSQWNFNDPVNKSMTLYAQ